MITKKLAVLLVVFLFCVTVCWSESVPQTNSGVLVGLRNDTGEEWDESTYRTFWITSESAQITVREATGIVTPYGDRFWQIDSRSLKGKLKTYGMSGDYGQLRIDYLSVHPLGQPSTDRGVPPEYLKSLTEAGWIDVVESVKLTFVGNKYTCVTEHNSYESGGTMRPWFRNIYVREIKNLNGNVVTTNSDKAKPEVSINQVFGEGARSYIKKYRSMKITEEGALDPQRYEHVENETDEYGWGLARKTGRWIPQIAKKWSYGNASTGFATYTLYDLPLPIPKNIVPYNNTMCNYEALKKVVPGIKDAVVSPNQSLSVVISGGELQVYPGSKFENPVRIKLGAKESIIMAEWAVGKYVPQWTQQLEKYFKLR